MNDQSQIQKRAMPDVETLRRDARKHIEDGAVTPTYIGNREEVVKLLNEALATELICVLRYRHDYFVARGIKAKIAAEEFLEHSNEEQGHADQIAERIIQLGGKPDFNPAGLVSRSHAEYGNAETLRDMIMEDLVAERVAIESYREIVQWLQGKDSTTRRLMEQILAVEEEHADDMSSLLKRVQ